MPINERVHDSEMLDILEQLDPRTFAGDAWRVVRSGRDPMRGSTANGRWGASGEFEVLYTACDRDGALAEIGYRMSLEPIWPSKIGHDVYRVEAALDRVLDLTDFVLLESLGIREDSYEGHRYNAEQAVSAAARFLGFQAILVPNARYPGNNLVVYPDLEGASNGLTQMESEAVDWNAWRARNRNRPSRRNAVA
jgi:RES domain